MPTNNQPVQPVPTPNSQIGATNNPQTAPTANKVPLSQSGYSASGSAMRKPGEDEAGFQSRAIEQKNNAQAAGGGKAGDMIYDPRLDTNATIKKFDPATSLSYTVGGASDPNKQSGILNTSGFQKPDASSYQSGTSLTSTIPNIMADNNVQSAIGNVTQPVATGVMRAVPKLSAWTAPTEKMNLWDASSVLDNI